jgi:hypothetical protein
MPPEPAAAAPAAAPPAAVPPAAAPPAAAPPTSLTPPEGTPPAATPPEGTPPAPVANRFADMTEGWQNDLLSHAGFEGDDLVKRQGQMARVSDMKTFATNYFSAQDKIRSGQMSTGLPADATPEQLTEWRAANDVPAEAAGYDVVLDEGLVLGDIDKAILEPVYLAGHAGNVSKKVMGSMVNEFLRGRELEQQAVDQQDGIHTQQTQVALRTAWGADYQRNMNVVQGFINGLPETVRADFQSARLGDGRALFNSPEIMVYFADKQMQINPLATVMPGSDNPVQATADRIKTLEAQMRKDSVAWHKDKDAQNELMRLYSAQDQHQENQR